MERRPGCCGKRPNNEHSLASKAAQQFHLEQQAEKVQQGKRPMPFPLSAAPPRQSLVNSKTAIVNKKVDRKEERLRNAERREARSKVIKPLKKRVEQAELEIQKLEERITELETIQCASDHYDRPVEVIKVAKEVSEKHTRLEQVMTEWEEAELELAETLEDFE